ncbi:MAG: hypothetical protein ABI183_08355 [Polyangiaceae bacterium]
MVDRASFLYIVGALAAGGGGGYLLNQHAHEKAQATNDAARQHSQEEQAALDKANGATANAQAEARAATAMLTSAPACDDAVGAPGDCPAASLPNASDEGLCGSSGSVAARRCKDFKSALKPKVAENAVACLNKLKGNETCDATRVALCGHEALMLACQDTPARNQSMVTSMNIASAPPPEPTPTTPTTSQVASQCDAILKGCSDATLGVSLSDCYRTLSGMNDVGRANMVTCMHTHCGDKGLLGCEAMPPPSP